MERWDGSRPPLFKASAPPPEWEAQHNQPRDWEDHAVPKRASCDFFRKDQDPRNFYFY